MFFRRKKSCELELFKGVPKAAKSIFTLYPDPQVKVLINKKFVSAFNRLVYAYEINRKFSSVFTIGCSRELVFSRTVADYFLFVLKLDNLKILSEEEHKEFTKLFEDAISEVADTVAMIGCMEQSELE